MTAALRLAVAVAVIVFVGSSLRAEPPVAPSPEQVTPVTHTVEVAPVGAGRLGPVPLPIGEADRKATSAARQATDFRLLAAIAAAFAVLAGFRFFTPGRRRAALPPDVFEVLGEAPLAGPHTARIVRFGRNPNFFSNNNASSGAIHPLASSCAPCPTSQLSRCPLITTTSSGFSLPRISPITFAPSASGRIFASLR